MDTLERLQTALAPHLHRILTPALVIDLDAVRNNVNAMIRRVGSTSRWRPHVKTVKQSVVVRILLDAGIRRFKCATTDELELVLGTARTAGASDELEILVAYPLSGPALSRALKLASDHPTSTVQLLADRPDHLAEIGAASADVPPVFLDVNVGMNRTGSPPATWSVARDAVLATPRVEIVGLHGYDGHHEWNERDRAHAAYDALTSLAREYGARQIITSGTHSYGHALAHEGLASGPWEHQVSAGTVVLSDLRSAPAAEDIGLRQAAFVASRVISQPEAAVLTLDAGSKGIAPDRPAPGLSVVGHPELHPLGRSEEHLPVRIDGATGMSPGDLAFLVPEHVCTTVNLYREALLLRGGELIGAAPVDAMSRTSWLEEPS